MAKLRKGCEMSNRNNRASWTIRSAAVLTLILPVGSADHCMANEGAATLVSIPNGGLENNGHGWSVERDGLEDFGYFMELKRRAANSAKEELCKEAERLLSVPQTVVMDAHYFNRNPAALLETRKEMAQLIDALDGR